MNSAPMRIKGLTEQAVDAGDGDIFVRIGGNGPALLLLHGFPQTSLMWRDLAPLLMNEFTIVAADLPGYGRSASPVDGDDRGSMSKRAIAAALVRAMNNLGHSRFAVAGHDRGGRVAYRMALDIQETVTHLAVLDVVPTAEVWDRADARLALSFWPSSLLAQPAPLPERLILGAPEAVVDNALGGWGTPAGTFSPEVRDEYVAALRSETRVHSIWEEYRAAASNDRDHDMANKTAGRRISCPTLALWSGKGGLAKWYKDEGGPLGLWRAWADRVQGEALEAGHFFPEELPQTTADKLRAFLHADFSP